jgi:hypothetical protein
LADREKRFLQTSGSGDVDRLQFRNGYEVTAMKQTIIAIGFVACYLQALPSASAQAFGEYSRALGGATQRQGSPASKPPRGSNPKEKVKGGFQGLGDLGVQPLQNRLVVAANRVSLYPSQDDETKKLRSFRKARF